HLCFTLFPYTTLFRSWLYVYFNGLPWIQKLFYGIGSAVIAVMVQGAYKLFQKTVKKDLFYQAIAATSALVTVVTESEIVWLFLRSEEHTSELQSRENL